MKISKNKPVSFKASNTSPIFTHMTDFLDGDTPLRPFDNIIPVVVCVNYDDFLALSLEANRKMFKEYIVITSPDDKNTQSLCCKYDVDCRIYEDFYKNSNFNKSGALNWAQKDIHASYPDKWILILDSDIILPPTFPRWFDPDCLNKEKLYGLVRKDFTTAKHFSSKVGNFIKEEICTGYFQLYFDKSKLYPSSSDDASVCDIIFKMSFDEHVALISHTLYIYHLGVPFINHRGRVSAKW